MWIYELRIVICLAPKRRKRLKKEDEKEFFYPQITQMDTDERLFGGLVSVEICVICG